MLINNFLHLTSLTDQTTINQLPNQEIQNLEKNSLRREQELVLHGLWYDIGSGVLEALDPISMSFIKI